MADNIGITGFYPGGLSSVGSTIYAFAQTAGRNARQFVSIPVTGASRGIATVIDSDVFAGRNAAIIPRAILGMEAFGSSLQFLMVRGSGVSAFNIDSSDGNFGDYNTPVYQESTTGANALLSITEYALQKPTIQRIPTQLVQEGQQISWPLTDYVTGETGYRIGTLTPVMTGAPIFPLEISNIGTITGTSGNRFAPFVEGDSYYNLEFWANNNAGETFQLLAIGVLNGPPFWDAVPEQFINEGQRISFSLAAYVQNNPTHFYLGAITKPRTLAPTLQLQISSAGIISGIGLTELAPQVDRDERYTVVVNAENTAGVGSTTVAITIQDLGELSDQIPYVLFWNVESRRTTGWTV